MNQTLKRKIPDYKKERCAKCRYRGTAGNDVICEYYLITGSGGKDQARTAK